jgi:hypothetical protein
MSFPLATLRMVSGLMIWAAHFSVIYGFTGLACARGLAGAVPWVIALATLAAVAACLLMAVQEIGQRQGFVSWMTAGSAGVALLAILWQALPVLLVPPCV